MVIEMHPMTKQVQVNGPITDKALCYAMLECAKDAIREFQTAQAQRIVPATTLPAFPPNGDAQP